MKPKEVFLSHSDKDKEKASRLAEALRLCGVEVWYSPMKIRPAQDFHIEIGRALRRCDWFLVLISKASICSTWVKRELAYALNHSHYDGHILPAKIEDCDHEELSWTLGIFQMVELKNSRWDDLYREILSAWGVECDPEEEKEKIRKEKKRIEKEKREKKRNKKKTKG